MNEDALLYRDDQGLDHYPDAVINLLAQRLDFLSPQSEFLCRNGTLNFVGALLFHQNQEVYKKKTRELEFKCQ